MATNKKNAPNVDLSDPTNYPDGRIKDNTGSGDGTPVNRLLYSDLHEFFAKLMRLANIAYNGLPDNEANGHQLVSAVIALAGKNDLLYSLSDVSGVINIATDLSIVKDGEVLLTKAGFNFASQTNIKGLTPALYGISVPSNFKNNDYVFLIKTGSSFLLQRMADGNNVDALVAEYNFLKAATDAEEFAGLSNAKATTPYTNQLAFARRVIGVDSGVFLASTSRNGLMSSADKLLLASIVNPVKNVGWFSGLDVGQSSQTGSLLPRSGDVVSATVTSVSPINGESLVRVVVSNPMIANNYFVRIHIESEGDIGQDDDCLVPVYKKETNTQFLIAFGEVRPSTQNLKVHLEVVQIS